MAKQGTHTDSQWELAQRANHADGIRQCEAAPYVGGTSGPEMRVWHRRPTAAVSRALPGDLGRENLFHDLPFADLQDL